MNLLSRTEAKKAGVLRYFTGAPCPHGHVCERYVSTWQCVECIAGQGTAWAKANPESRRATSRAWRKANPEQARAQKAANQKRNRATANVRQKRYHATHREMLNAKTSAWQKANPAKNLAKRMRRVAAQFQRTPAWADHEAIDLVYQAAQIAKVTWPEVEIHVDHVVPLRGRAVSGFHVHNNLRILTAQTNRSKSNHSQGA